MASIWDHPLILCQSWPSDFDSAHARTRAAGTLRRPDNESAENLPGFLCLQDWGMSGELAVRLFGQVPRIEESIETPMSLQT